MRSYRAGKTWALLESHWPDVRDADERTPDNAEPVMRAYESLGPEWLTTRDGGQRMVLRLRDMAGRELNLTRRELAHNGIRMELQ